MDDRHSAQLVAKGYKVEPLTEKMLDKGYVGNGCGAKALDKIIILIMLWWYGVEIRYSCDIHDAGYSCSRSVKSEAHKIQVDADFAYNLRVEMVGHKKKVIDRIVRRFHAAVVLRGKSAYWTQ